MIRVALALRPLALRPLALCLLALCLLAPCLFGPCTALASGPNRVFGYERDGKMRLCRGNTTTGVADCVDGTPESAWQKDGKKPMWAGVRDATIRWLRYPNPHVGAVSAQGLYEFLVIYDKRQPWVCTGDTRTGLLVCAAGTATSGQSRAISPPEFTIDPKRVLSLTRWFWLEPQGTVGDYSFGSYKGVNGALRVCRMRTDSGDTTCADSTPLSSSETARQRPRWTLRTLTSRFYRFFRASVQR